MMRFVVVALLFACSSSSKPRPVTNTGAGHPWFERVDLVVIENGKLVAYALGATPTELARLDLPENSVGPFVDGDWADREHLFLRVDNRQVLQLSRDGLVAVSVPPAEKFAAPRPATENAQDLMPGGPGDDGGLVVTAEGVFWAECPWGFPADGFQCEGWRVARIWPTPSEVAARPELPASIDHFEFPDAAPPGAALETANEGVVCKLAGKSSTLDLAAVRAMVPDDDEDKDDAGGEAWQLHDDSAVLGAHWLSAKPPRLLVRWGSPGYDSLVEYAWSIHDGCGAAPIDKGRFAKSGPAPYWADHGKQIDIRRGTERIMTVSSEATVFFRPR